MKKKEREKNPNLCHPNLSTLSVYIFFSYIVPLNVSCLSEKVLLYI